VIIKSVQGTEQAEQKASRKEIIMVCKHQMRPGRMSLPCQNIAFFGQLISGSS